MLKNIINLKGAQKLTKKEQKAVQGGIDICFRQCGPAGGVPDRNHPGVCICF
jgi:hypothetical protein